MNVFLIFLTYFGYAFITAMYSIKVLKYLRLPRHIRWDLYPVPHEERSCYEESYFEDLNWFARARHKRRLRNIWYLLKECFTLGEYFKHHRSYWAVLFPWHIGFILIITFHICTFFAALAMVLGLPVSSASTFIAGRALYYLVLLIGGTSFTFGIVGSIGIIMKRLIDYNLRLYATPQNYFTYLFCLAVFTSGFYAWAFVDPTFGEYRAFWASVITGKPVTVDPEAALHIILFDLFLIYLPFTRSMHYITRFFAFFLIQWDDEPNVRGGKLEKTLTELFWQRVDWSAPHIKSGKTWREQVEK